MILLTSERGRASLIGVELAILDEIHAIIEDRRGVMLLSCLERLVELTGEFQRVALSATANPLSVVAQAIGGWDSDGQEREVEIVEVPEKKEIDWQVKFPQSVKDGIENDGEMWPPLFEELLSEIRDSKSTLYFSNMRRQAETVAVGINSAAGYTVAYSHHGSLARDIRLEVEQQLKAGDLKAIVATNSLELGIDIGDLDKVVLVQSPFSISSAVQRLGRSGHRVDQTSRCVLYPTHSFDFVDAAALSGAISEGDLEPLKPMLAPLDLLAQLVISIVATEECHKSDILRGLRRSYPYKGLDEMHFDLILEMLAGRYHDARIRELRPRISVDTRTGMVQVRKGALLSFYASGGVIPDRGYFQLKLRDGGQKLGELDEEFVWESKVGRTFSFGTQSWTIDRITHNDVIVRPSNSSKAQASFWKSETYNRSVRFSDRVNDFLEVSDQHLARGEQHELEHSLVERGFDQLGATKCIEFLESQRAATHASLPHSNHILYEHVASGPGGYRLHDLASHLLIHCMWGNAVNRPIALALETQWRKEFDTEPEIFVDNRIIGVQLRFGEEPEDVCRLLQKIDLRKDIRQTLENSGFFAGRFRECAGRSLLLAKSSFNRRVPLWLTRQHAQKLQASVMQFEDFPILLETWRTCLEDEFDMSMAEDRLHRIQSGSIKTTLVVSETPSPFAAGMVRNQVNELLYRPDHAETTEISNLSSDLIASVVDDASLRPVLDPEVVDEVVAKLQRRAPGYMPADEEDQLLWLKERVWIPSIQWFEQLDVPTDAQTVERDGRSWLIHADSQSVVSAQVKVALSNAVQFYGPFSREDAIEFFPLALETLQEILTELVADGVLYADVKVAGESELYFCDAGNLELLLRYQRRAKRADVTPLVAEQWPAFIAEVQKFGTTLSEDNVLACMERLRGYSAPIGFWLGSAWQARVLDVSLADINETMLNYQIEWQGTRRNWIKLDLREELSRDPDVDNTVIRGAFMDPDAGYQFDHLLGQTELGSSEFNDQFWEAVWDGVLSSEDLNALQFAMAREFKVVNVHRARPRHISKRLPARQRFGWPGTWRLIQANEEPENAITALEQVKEDCRLLLSRYGCVTKEIANREGSKFKWRRLFPGLRLMELSGEITTGHFFKGLSGPQFILPQLVSAVASESLYRSAYWLSAVDPASPCGLGFQGQKLPNRVVNNSLGFANGMLCIVSESSGRKFRFLVEPDDDRLHELLRLYFEFMDSNKRVAIEAINDESPLDSPFLAKMLEHLPIRKDHKGAYFDIRGRT